mmetsp:Transcript_4560/g.6791  ORF Transcript_4560/g.6791 Transcript_4560/m.6791 type:complete len:541 (+) Transcript_4560:134-1756(+)
MLPARSHLRRFAGKQVHRGFSSWGKSSGRRGVFETSVFASVVAASCVLATQLNKRTLLLDDDGPSDTVASIKQYPANRPIEDRCYMERLSNGSWWFSVFDGHGGWQCSDYASKRLHENLSQEMANYLGEKDSEGPIEEKIDRRVVAKALKSAFERTDRQYMVKVFGAFELGFGRDTRAGSCVLGTLVVDGVLFVANAGDSRAVLAVNSEAYEKSSQLSRRQSKAPGRGTMASSEAEVDMHGWDIDELMGAAAVKDSSGEHLDPKVAEALRAKLLNQIYNLQQAEKAKGSEDLNPAQEPAVVEEKKHVGKPNVFVNAVRMLTGGQVSSSDDDRYAESSDKGPSPRFVAIDMSNDHNCREVRERERLERLHPNEKDVVICRVDNPEQCYIKGKLQPTRAFGDFYLKYSEFMRGPLEDAAAGRYVPPPYTPPYISATPEVQIRTMQKGVDEFLIMATDGLWDVMSSQEAVEIAGEQLRKRGGNPAKASDVLVEEALRRAAKNHKLSTSQLKALKPGRARRSKHDDISVIVIDVSKLIQMHYWG